MESRFLVRYEETKKTLIAFCEIFHQEKCEMSTLVTVGVVGPIVLVMMFIYGNPGGGTVSGIAFFLLKFICVWAAAFFAGDILARTFLRSMMMTTAIGDGEELYKRRVRPRKEPLVVDVVFYDDHVVNDTGTQQKSFLYADVTKLLESDKALGVLVDQGLGPKSFFGIPKDGVVDGDIDSLKEFLAGKCTRVHRGFKKI